MRRGELQALRWEDVDLAGGHIYVRRAFDDKAHMFIAPKSVAGSRRVPLAGVLRDYLDEHKVRSRREEGLVFGKDGYAPFTPSSALRRALRDWRAANGKRASSGLTPLVPITFHECRHTFASLLIDIGVNVKAISSHMGHASVSTTLDRYGKLMPGSERETAERLDAYLRAAETAVRGAATDTPPTVDSLADLVALLQAS